MIRTSLDANSPNISASVDQRGDASVQYIKNAVDSSNEVHIASKNASVIQLEKDGNDCIIRVAKFGEPFITQQVTNLNLGDDVFVGFVQIENAPGLVIRLLTKSHDDETTFHPAGVCIRGGHCGRGYNELHGKASDSSWGE